MKNTGIALMALATLAISPLAFAGTLSVVGAVGTSSFDLTGTYTTAGGINTVVSSMTGTFTQIGAGLGNTTAATYVVVNPTHAVFMGKGTPTVKNDNTYAHTDTPFSTSGLLIKLTSGLLKNDYVYFNNIGSLDSGQSDVSVFTKLTGNPAKTSLSSVNYYVDLTPNNKTPEPSALVLLGTGLFSMAGLLFWKSKGTANSLPAVTL